MSVIDFLRGFFNPTPDDVAGRSLQRGEQALLEGKRAEDERNDERRRAWDAKQDEMREAKEERDRSLHAPALQRKAQYEEVDRRSVEENGRARLVASGGAARAPVRGR